MKKQSDGRYRAKITVGHTFDGTPVVKYVSGRTKKELEAAKQEALRLYVLGVTDKQRKVLFGEYAMDWYETYKEPTISYSSKQSYETIFARHLMPTLEYRPMRAISANELQQLLNATAVNTASAVGYMCSILSAVFKLAYSQGIIDRDPTVALRKPTRERATRRALTDAEASAALTVARTHPHGLLIYLLFYTGMRLGEVCGLTWADVDFKERVIHVRRDVDFKTGELGSVKTKYSVRDVPIVDALMPILFAARGIGYVCPAPDGDYWRNTALFRAWKDIARAMADVDSGIEQEKGVSVITPHYFRHNFASVLYNAGVDVLAAQRILGHAKAQTTLDIYSHLSEQKAKTAADKISAAFSNI